MPDGYLGSYTADRRWISWDVWRHKCDLIGLLTYWRYTGDARYLKFGEYIASNYDADGGPGVLTNPELYGCVCRVGNGHAGEMTTARGPLVLAFDQAHIPDTEMPCRLLPAAGTSSDIDVRPAPSRSLSGEPVFETEGRLAGGAIRPVYLVPFAFAGQDGKSVFDVAIACQD